MGAKDAYLIAYNCACCAGWAFVLQLAFRTVVGGILSGEDGLLSALASVYATPLLKEALYYSQTAALLEIVHAQLKLVRSPVMVTAMQVGSRIVALYAIQNSVPAQLQWGAGCMILSWSMVEVPRYAFYVMALFSGDATKKTPYPLFWLRYSLFAVLYPSGITGELTVFLAAAADEGFCTPGGAVAFLYGTFLPVVYFFGSPFMILNMAGNRKSAMKKRFAKPPPPPRGLCWPSVPDKKTGKMARSSTETNRAIVAAALEAIDPALAQACRSTKSWRFGYVKHLKALVQAQCQSPEAALKAAQAGLDKAYELFEFVAPDGSAVSLQQAMAAPNTEKFYTGTVSGTKKLDAPNELKVPYKGKILSGQALKDQVNKWVDYGTIEPSAGEAINKCVDHPEWIGKAFFQQRYFCLVGAGSAMGPLKVLLAAGAHVIAVDLDRPGIWKHLIGLVEDSPGSMTFPLNVSPDECKTNDDLAAHAGCNLFTHTPLIRDWLLQLYPGKPMTVGSYAYLDGALHVQVSLAMDAICRDLSEKRNHTSLAYLCTPTDLHLIPKEAHEAAKENYKEYSGRLYCMFMRVLGSGKYLRKNYMDPIPGKKGGDDYYYLVNGISIAQGPNYALAKRMQHWRAIIARSKGCIVSSNIAPSTSTVSVVHNRTFAWAYEGMPYFRPYEIAAPDLSKAVMLALLAYDLNDPASVGNPKTALNNPNQLFSYGSFHGGLWRCAYEVDSIGEASVFLYFGRVAQPFLMGAGAVGAALVAYLYAS